MRPAVALIELRSRFREQYTRPQIAALYELHRKGGYVGREQEWARLVHGPRASFGGRGRPRREALIKILVSAVLLRSDSCSRALPDPIVLVDQI